MCTKLHLNNIEVLNELILCEKHVQNSFLHLMLGSCSAVLYHPLMVISMQEGEKITFFFNLLPNITQFDLDDVVYVRLNNDSLKNCELRM